MLLKMSLKNNYFVYVTCVIIFSCVYLLLGLAYYKLLPILVLFFLFIPSAFFYIKELFSFNKVLVDKGKIKKEIYQGSFISTGYKIFEKSNDVEIEECRKKVVYRIYMVILSFFYLMILSISIVYR